MCILTPHASGVLSNKESRSCLSMHPCLGLVTVGRVLLLVVTSFAYGLSMGLALAKVLSENKFVIKALCICAIDLGKSLCLKGCASELS